MNKNFFRSFEFAIFAVVFATSSKSHGDMVRLEVVDDRVATSLESGITGVITPERIFQTELAWNVARGAFTTTMPGFSWSSDFAVNDWLTFDIAGPLFIWNGAGVQISSVPMNLTYLANTVTSGQKAISGYAFQIPVDEHAHFMRYSLVGLAQGQGVGVYILPLEIRGVTNPFKPSDTIFIIFNQGSTPAHLAAATDYVQQGKLEPRRRVLAGAVDTQRRPTQSVRAQ